jgi:hypothetical protein
MLHTVLHRSRETRHTMPATVVITRVDPDFWPTLPRTAAACAHVPSAALRMTHARAHPTASRYAPMAPRRPVGNPHQLGNPYAGTA